MFEVGTEIVCSVLFRLRLVCLALRTTVQAQRIKPVSSNSKQINLINLYLHSNTAFNRQINFSAISMTFHHSAEDIRIDDGHILRARLQNGEGEWVDAEFDLNNHIGNDNGISHH